LLLRALAANLVMTLLLWWLAGPTADWVDAEAAARALRLTGVIISAAMVYGAVLLMLGLRPQHLREPPMAPVRDGAGGNAVSGL
jgi:peptidoglycan biosynthesis protein MviN/MurJ (putative lipid II flippase)